MAGIPTITLKPKEDARLRAGHRWAFSNEIASREPEDLAPGSLAFLFDSQKAFLGQGFYHPNSLIAFRVLSTQKDDVINTAFFVKRLTEAKALRETLYPGSTSYRWMFGESDGVTGLVIDRYDSVVVVLPLSAGIEQLKPTVIEAIQQVLSPEAIIWRTDAAGRELEGLEPQAPEVIGTLSDPLRTIETENGLFQVDLLGGQKTGFYFDQRENRQVFASWCKNKRVLDAFCYSGGFGISAARAGATQVVFADSSGPALALAKTNAQLNGVESRCTFVEGDVPNMLDQKAEGKPFDVISLDPPAFARSKKHLQPALKAYEKINMRAMALLPRGGILATSSCSHHVTPELFLTMLRKAANKAGRSLRLLEFRSQAKDHPRLLAMPETEYLKFALLQIS